MEDSDWLNLLEIAKQLAQDYPDSIFIGGLAVFEHAKTLGSNMLESSHDIDFYISMQGHMKLRDEHQVYRNERLQKDSVLVNGQDLDAYVEHRHGLCVPYDQLAANSILIDGMRIASLEHLLILKIDAARNRMGTGKGEKDMRDLARIVLLLDKPNMKLLRPYLNDDRAKLLKDLGQRGTILIDAGFNQHEAAKVRRSFDQNLAALRSDSRDR